MNEGSKKPVVLVTGAGRGIGREVAVRLAQGGWAVGLNARSADELAVTADLIHQAGGSELTVVGDVGVASEVERICDAVEDGLGPVEALINNAAVAGEYAEVTGGDPGIWWQTLEINLRAPFLFCHRLVPAMVERASGYVINVNSLDCARSARDGSPAYSVSKTALRRMTEIMALQLEGTGVVVVDLSPGMVRTAMGGGRPDADKMPPEAWMPPTPAADRVEEILSGRFDDLAGRFLHARDDLGALMAEMSGKPDARMLRLVPAGDNDAVLAYGTMTSHRSSR